MILFCLSAFFAIEQQAFDVIAWHLHKKCENYCDDYYQYEFIGVKLKVKHVLINAI